MDFLKIQLLSGTEKYLKGLTLTKDGDIYDPARGPECDAVQSRKDLLDERRRKAVTHKTATQAAREHFLYNLTCKFSF